HPREPGVARDGVADVRRRWDALERLLDDVEDALRPAPAEDGVEPRMRRLDDVVEHRREGPLRAAGRALERVDRRQLARDPDARELASRQEVDVARLPVIADRERLLS